MPAHRFSSVKSCVQILNVGSHVLYSDLMHSCVCFLTTMEWSGAEEERIRELVTSLSLPPDCVADISARSGNRKSKQEVHDSLVELIERTLVDQLVEGMVCSRELHQLDRQFRTFCRVFPEVMKELCPTMTKTLLAVINDEIRACLHRVKSVGLFNGNRMVTPEFVQEVTIMSSLLKTLVESGVAKDAVVSMAKDRNSSVCIDQWIYDTNDKASELKKRFVETMFSIFKDVQDGHILLRSIAELFTNWQRVLWRDTARSQFVLNEVILTLPLSAQLKIYKRWKFIGLFETCEESTRAISGWVKSFQFRS